VNNKSYYTNSFHVPVDFPISYADKIAIEAPYHQLCNGGHISYVEFDDYPSGELIEKVLR
jgi:ribonucleoside-triphosphate reductase